MYCISRNVGSISNFGGTRFQGNFFVIKLKGQFRKTKTKLLCLLQNIGGKCAQCPPLLCLGAYPFNREYLLIFIKRELYHWVVVDSSYSKRDSQIALCLFKIDPIESLANSLMYNSPRSILYVSNLYAVYIPLGLASLGMKICLVVESCIWPNRRHASKEACSG